MVKVKGVKKLNSSIIWLSVSLMILLFSIGLAMSVGAENMSPRIGVSPHTFSLEVIPGQVVKDRIKISNQSQFPIPMAARVINFTAEENSGMMILDEYSQDPSFTSRFWFKIETPDFILDPGETKKIRFQIQVPKDAEPGGHYAVLVFEPKLPSFYFKEQTIIRNIPEIGVIFLTSVKKFTLEPEIGQELEVVEFSLQKEKRLFALENFISKFAANVALAANINIVESSYLNFTLRIKNNDIYHIKPSGKLLVYNFSGKKVGEAEVPQRTILPGKTRIFPIEFQPETPEILKWLPSSISTFLIQNSFLGNYQAKLELQAKSPVATELIYLNPPNTLAFFSLPWKFWLTIILFSGGLVFYSVRYKERIKKAAEILLVSQKKRFSKAKIRKVTVRQVKTARAVVTPKVKKQRKKRKQHKNK